MIQKFNKFKTKDMGEFFFNIPNRKNEEIDNQPNNISRKEERQPVQSQDKMFHYQMNKSLRRIVKNVDKKTEETWKKNFLQSDRDKDKDSSQLRKENRKKELMKLKAERQLTNIEYNKETENKPWAKRLIMLDTLNDKTN